MTNDIHDRRIGVAMENVSGTLEGGANNLCHTYTGGVKAGKKHVMRNPRVVIIFWGNNYVTNPDQVSSVVQLVSDFVTGPFLNGLVQYGVGPGSVAGQFVIDTNQNNPAPATLDEKQAQSQIISWLTAGTVTPAPSVDETNLLYFLFPPTTTQLKLSNGITGFCGYHEHGKFHDNSQNDDLFWAIVKTTGAATATGTAFANRVSPCVGHELAEAFSDRDKHGYIADNGCEIGDICEFKAAFRYRGWLVQQYWSGWDSACIRVDQPVSIRKFLGSIGFDFSQGLRSLNTPVIDLQYLASRE